MTSSYSFLGTDHNERKLRWMILISCIVHIILFSIFIGKPPSSSKNFFFNPVYTVSLVDLPPAFPDKSSRGGKQMIQLWESKKGGESHLKTQAERAHDILTIPVKKLGTKKKIKNQQPPPSGETVFRQGHTSKTFDKTQLGSSAQPGSSNESSITGNAAHNLRLSHYYQDIWEKIQQSWTFPDFDLQSTQKLEAILIIRIRRDGKILSSEFEKKSGDPRLDRSVLRAVKKAAPLPPLPDDFRGEYLEVGLRFIPSGSQQ